ncbi:hypothetical protein [Immundisolibacter sp.]
MTATTQEKIVQLEKDANKLVNNLELLYKKAGSYNAAKEELQKTNAELVILINETMKLSQESHTIITKINEIGSSQIFKQLEKIDKSIFSFNDVTQKQFHRNKMFLLSVVVLLVVSLVMNIIIYLK